MNNNTIPDALPREALISVAAACLRAGVDSADVFAIVFFLLTTRKGRSITVRFQAVEYAAELVHRIIADARQSIPLET